MATTDFTLIRHGQTTENIEGRLQGHFDSRLDETGLIQAEAAAVRLAGEQFDVIYSSDLQRARKTAEIIAAKLKMDVIPMRELREWHLGELENRLCKELWAEYPEIMNCFRCENDDVPVPGGESHREFDKRIADWEAPGSENPAGYARRSHAFHLQTRCGMRRENLSSSADQQCILQPFLQA